MVFFKDIVIWKIKTIVFKTYPYNSFIYKHVTIDLELSKHFI